MPVVAQLMVSLRRMHLPATRAVDEDQCANPSHTANQRQENPGHVGHVEMDTKPSSLLGAQHSFTAMPFLIVANISIMKTNGLLLLPSNPNFAHHD